MAKARSTTGRGATSRRANPPGGSRGDRQPETPNAIEGERELIVIASPSVALRASAAGLASAAGADVSGLADTLAQEGASMRPLFGLNEERLLAEADVVASFTGAPLSQIPDLSIYYKVDAPDDRLDALAEQLLAHAAVDAAFVKPPAAPAVAVVEELNDMLPSLEEPPATTPDFTPRQGYLDPAPGGVDARFAWTVPGGSGSGVRIIDVEGAWRFTHEDLTQNQGGVVGGTQSTDIGWRNHGTAVAGEIGGDRNSFGITGIAPDAFMRSISIFGGTGSAGAIRQAANLLGPGDIILIELHRPGPRFNFTSPQGQRGYIPVEWWPDDFAAIQFATGRGVLVVEAGGNGSENLDDAIYNTPAAGFPSGWTNPFNRANRDSGAIVVGAGAPPPGMHGRDYGPDRSRLDFSNWGAMVDVQGWGREVTTTGYGDLQGGASEDLWYTDVFSGTSSASPFVVGVLACVQGVLRARSMAPLNPARARQLLRTTGSPQQNAPARPTSQRIGNRPNLRALIQRATKTTIKENIKPEIKENIKPEIKEVKENIKSEIKEVKEKENIKIEKLEKLEQKENIKQEHKENIKSEVEGKNMVQEKIADGKLRDVIDPSGLQGGGPSFMGTTSMSGLSDTSALLLMVLERLDQLESRFSTGQPFISGEERPDVGSSTAGGPNPR